MDHKEQYRDVSLQNYVELAGRTDLADYAPVINRVLGDGERGWVASSVRDVRMLKSLHACLGLTTEVGEVSDIFKKFLHYGKPIDHEHLEEEIGDILWYVALLLDAHGFTLADVLQKNIDKLRSRYPGAFSEEKALDRTT